MQILSTVVPGICYPRTRSYLGFVRTCVPVRLQTYSSMCRFLFLDGRFGTPGAMTRCSVRNTECMVHMGRLAGKSGALAMPFLVLAGSFDGTEGNLRPSNAPHKVHELHVPHAWGTC